MADNKVQSTLDLSADEVAGLRRIAAGSPPYNERAQALLALAEGADLAGAALASNLTVNQARYWLGRFRPRRLEMFPEELLAAHTDDAREAAQQPLLDAPEEAPLLEAPHIAGELPAGIIEDPLAIAAGTAATAVAAKKTGKKKKGKQKEAAKKSKKKSASGKRGKKAKKKKKSDKKGKKSKKSKQKKSGKKKKKKGEKK